MTTAHVIFAMKEAKKRRMVVNTRPREYAGAYVRASTEAAAEKAKSWGMVGILCCANQGAGFGQLMLVSDDRRKMDIFQIPPA